MMVDREKVKKGLKEHGDRRFHSCDNCPYVNSTGCQLELCSDALALLEEQEPVEPEVEVLNEIDRLYRCPKCHKCFFYEKQKYCDQCGQEVKWE